MDSVKLDPKRRSASFADFDRGMRSKVIGQPEAVDKIVEMYQLYKAGLGHPSRPIGNLLFLGPTGTGKTRTVEAMAETLFGDSKAMLKIDCAEFQHSHEIAKLIGSPPGYLGHRETHPLLTQERLNAWQTNKVQLSLLLFDEIEKASDSLWKLLLGILDKATLTLGDNRVVDFSNCLIFMTSNCGAAEIQGLIEGGLGFGSLRHEKDSIKSDKINAIAKNAAKSKFSPEFMNRLDKIVVFNNLEDVHYGQILEIELGAVQTRILLASGTSQFVFKCTPVMKDFLLREGFDQKYNARHLKRAIETNVVFPMANLITTEQIKLGDFIRVDYINGEVTFNKEGMSDTMTAHLLDKYAKAAVVSCRRSGERSQYPNLPRRATDLTDLDDIEF